MLQSPESQRVSDSRMSALDLAAAVKGVDARGGQIADQVEEGEEE